MIQTEVSFSCHCFFEMLGAKEQTRAIIFKLCGVPMMGGFEALGSLWSGRNVDGLSDSWILFITSYGKCASVPKHLHQLFLYIVLFDQDCVVANTSICFVEKGWNKDFWVGLCSWVGVYVLVYYPWHLDCQKAKGNSSFNQLDVIKTSQNHNVSLTRVQKKKWVAPIFKTSTFEVPKILSQFSPLRSVGFCLWLGLGLRFPRWNTAALRSRERPRFRGRAAPGGEGSRGCEGQRRPWPRRRILVGKPHEALGFRCDEVNGDVDGSSVSWILSSIVCQNICTNIFCCSLWSGLCRCLHLNLLWRNRMK